MVLPLSMAVPTLTGILKQKERDTFTSETNA
jgi:hypothetical protein